MLSDRISAALETMDVTISDVARAGGCTPSNLNRVKNGVRTPPPSSPTIRLLTEGFMRLAAERYMTGELMKLCGASLRDSKEDFRSKLIQWLYEDEPPYIRPYRKREPGSPGEDHPESLPAVEFSKRLDLLMKTAVISNRRLGRESGLDPSYISRLRRGERIPRYQSPYLTRICRILRDSVTAEGKLAELSGLTSIAPAELSDKDGADTLRRWLFGYGAVTGYMAADELMGTIASIDKLIHKAHAAASSEHDIERIIGEAEKSGGGTVFGNEEKYFGTGRLRTAVTRFLAEMIKNGEKELLLYSDQPMDWMEGDFRQVLTALMAELIKEDVKISALHSVNRSITELVFAVEWWMPLYLSGKIVSYYCMPSAGRRFSHTLFIRPGAACVAGTSVVGLESRTVYSYSTDSEVTALAEESFRSLLQNSGTLVGISDSGEETPEDDGYIQTDKVMVKVTPDQVMIRRTEPPYLMFTFTHPMIVSAFRAYMNSR